MTTSKGTGRRLRLRLAVTLLTLVLGCGLGLDPVAAATGSASSGTPAYGLPPLGTAGTFLLTEIRQKTSGDWAGAWQTLYPAHQRIAPRANFVRCERASSFPAPLDSIRVVRVKAERVEVSGQPHRVRGVAVTVAVELRWYGPRDPITLTHAFHLVPVAGHWTWLLSAERYRLYRHGACSTGSI